jgi:hypothetical protein
MISDRVKLGSRPTVVDAPPSQLAEYPTVAVWIEKSDDALTMSDVVLQDASGNLLAGAAATDDNGVILDGDVVQIADGVTLSTVGTIRCEGRIWVGSRYPAKREEIEEAIWFAFNQNDAAPGRLTLSLNGHRLGDMIINIGSVATVDLLGSSWSGEHSFEARLWSWNRFTMDMSLMVPRFDPLAQHLILEFSENVTTPVLVPADVNKLADLEKYEVDATGYPTPTTI